MTLFEKNEAERVAEGVKGVANVINNLAVTLRYYGPYYDRPFYSPYYWQ